MCSFSHRSHEFEIEFTETKYGTFRFETLARTPNRYFSNGSADAAASFKRSRSAGAT